MKVILIKLIKLYQNIPGPWHASCRHIPTCSNYAIEAITKYGSLKGSFLSIKRILKCNPLGTYGYDPVPIKEKKMKQKKSILLLILLITIIFSATGCKQDDMEDITINVTNYPNEFIAKKLYGNHATINSIYPDGVDTTTYKISNKNKQEISNKDLFIYNGLIEKERDLAVELLDLNQSLKIIDTAYVLETDYSPEELWLNPSSLLMMAQNVRLGLEEYITSNYLKQEIDDSYNSLKIKLSELDADYRVAVENTDNKTIVVANSALKYLEKFGLNVICIDSDATDKTISTASNLMKNGTISYIYSFSGDKLGDNAKDLLEKYPNVKNQQLHRLDNLSDSDRSNNKNYFTIINDNLDLIKTELYQ